MARKSADGCVPIQRQRRDKAQHRATLYADAERGKWTAWGLLQVGPRQCSREESAAYVKAKLRMVEQRLRRQFGAADWHVELQNSKTGYCHGHPIGPPKVLRAMAAAWHDITGGRGEVDRIRDRRETVDYITRDYDSPTGPPGKRFMSSASVRAQRRATLPCESVMQSPRHVCAVGPRAACTAGRFAHDGAALHAVRLAAQVGVRLPTLLARHARFTFALRGPQPERLACWIDASGAYGAGLSSYGQPVGTSGCYAVGVSEQEADYPATMAAEQVSRQAREVARRYVQAALPGLDSQPEAELQCTSNRTGFADGDGFGAVQRGAVTVVYGNNLFKFAPLLGDRLAHAVVHQELPTALRTWTLARG